jgi:parvulin-like peptidyl-prolyl isomerase
MPHRLILLLSALAIAIGAGCGNSSSGSSTASNQKVPPDAVANVAGHPILRSEFNHYMGIAAANYKQNKQPIPKPGSDAYQKLQQSVLQFLVQRIEIGLEAKKAHVAVDQKKVDQTLAADVKARGGKPKFDQYLKASGATEADIRDQIVYQTLSQALFTKITAAAKVSDAQVAAQYAKDKDTVYKTPKSIKVEHILIGPKKQPAQGKKISPADYAKYLATARKVLALVNGGQDFAKLVSTYSTDPGKTQNKGVYDVTETGFDPAFTKASFALRKGQVTSAPVRSNFGYHIIKALSDPTASGVQPLSKVKDQIKQQLLQQAQNKLANDFVTSILKYYKAHTTFAPGYSLPPPATTGTGTTGATTAP